MSSSRTKRNTSSPDKMLPNAALSLSNDCQCPSISSPSSNFSSLFNSDDDPVPAPDDLDVKVHDAGASAYEKQVAYVTNAISGNMAKLEAINKAHLAIGTLLAQQSRALAGRALYTCKLKSITNRLHELSILPSAISDIDLRKEFTILESSKEVLETMISRIPEQLAMIRQSLPLAMRAAEEEEAKVAAIVEGLHEWRQLAANCDRWRLEGDPPQIIFDGSHVTTTGGQVPGIAGLGE